MTDLALHAIDVATGLGAAYADCRLITSREQAIVTRNGDVATLIDAESSGIGVRVIMHDADGRGAWGFAATAELSRSAVETAATEAVAVAKASTLAQRTGIRLTEQSPVVAEWHSPARRDPFEISLDDKIALLLAVDGRLRRVNGVSLARPSG